MNLDNLSKKQITTLIRCLHEAIIQTNKNLSKIIISDKEDEKKFNKINKHLQEVKQLHALLVGYRNEMGVEIMQKVKFRAWVIEEKIMVEVKEINFEHQYIQYKKYEDVEKGYENKYVGFDEIELMQYTGLKDKNGVEIYEGDIIKAKPYGKEAIGKVCYTGCDYEVLEKTDDPLEFSDYVPMTRIGSNVLYEARDEYPSFGNRLEVIGNIYENLDLLEK